MQLSTKLQNPIIQIIYALERLHDASTELGMTEDDVVTLLASGMSLSHLLDYVDDMVSNHAN